MSEQNNLVVESLSDEIKSKLGEIQLLVAENAKRVAELGKWPEHIKPGSLSERVPTAEKNAPGFDAGIACALSLIPEGNQDLPAALHANYTKGAVLQVREEIMNANADTSTSWWLAACSICNEGDVSASNFLKQIDAFKALVLDENARLEAAQREYSEMISSFSLVDGAPYGEKDGCIQGAYIAGYPFGSMYAEKYGIYFVGTYEDSLGLEDFKWSEEKDAKGRLKSGPVFGSKQFVKCSTKEEWEQVVKLVKDKFSAEMPKGVDASN